MRCLVNPYDDTPDTWIPLPELSCRDSRPGPGRCGCNPTFGPACDGQDEERREMWRLPRAERVALELRNLRLDPHWRALHDTTDTTGSAA